MRKKQSQFLGMQNKESKEKITLPDQNIIRDVMLARSAQIKAGDVDSENGGSQAIQRETR